MAETPAPKPSDELLKLVRQEGLLKDADLDQFATLDPTQLRRRLLQSGTIRPDQLKDLNRRLDESISDQMTLMPASTPSPAARADALDCPVCDRPMTAYGSGGSASYSCEHCGTHVNRRPRVEAAQDTLKGAPDEVRQAAADASRRFGTYILISELGKGGMGAVHRAWDTRLGRWVALKFLRSEGEGDLDRFIQEARTSAGIDHPNVVAIYDAGQIDGRHFISMQLVEGDSLNRLRLPLAEAVEAIRAACVGVQAAHDKSVIHRDLKPHNMMYSKSKHVFVMDFGLARSTKNPGHLSMSGSIIGTPAFMSPEQAQALPDVDARTDIYGLGASLYHLATGAAPFEAPNLGELLAKVVQDDPPSPRTLNPKVDRDLETVILKCLEKDPGRRYPTARELAEDLERYLKGDPILARRLLPGVRLWRKLRRNPVALGIAATALIGGIGGGIYAAREIKISRDKTRLAEINKAEEEKKRLAEEERSKAAEELRKAEEIKRKEADERAAKAAYEAQARQRAETIFAPARREQMEEVEKSLKSGEREAIPALLEEILEYERRAQKEDPTFQEGSLFKSRILRQMGEREQSRAILDTLEDPLAILELAMHKAAEFGEQREIAVRRWMDREMEAVRRGELTEPRVHTDADLFALNPDLGSVLGEARGFLETARERLIGRKANDEIRCGEARLAIFNGRLDEAEKVLEKIQTADAMMLRGSVYEARRDYPRARDAYRGLLEVYKGLEEPYLALARLLRVDLDGAWWKEPKEGRAAIESLGAHWEASPAWVRGRATGVAESFRLQGDFLLERQGLDPNPAYAKSLEAGLPPPAVLGLIRLGQARWGARQGDPGKLLEEARAALTEAGDLATVGEAWMVQARYDADHGADPRAAFGGALEAFGRGGGGLLMLVKIAGAHSERAEYLSDHGGDPVGDFDAAIKILDGALKDHPDDVPALGQQGRLLVRRARWEAAQERDPTAFCGGARGHFTRAIGLRKEDASLYRDAGIAWSVEAEWKLRHGGDPTADVERAIGQFAESLLKRPDPEVSVDRAEALAVRADWIAFDGGDPQKAYAEAIEAFVGEQARAHGGRGRAAERLGSWLSAHGRAKEAQEQWTAAGRSLARATQTNATSSRDFLQIGRAERQAGDLALQQFDDPSAPYGRARASLTKAFALNGNLWQARAEEASVLAGLAKWEAMRGTDSAGRVKEARDLLAAAPPAPEVNALRGRLAEQQAVWLISRGRDASVELKEARRVTGSAAVALLEGDFDGAEQALRAAHKRGGPDPASVRRDLGIVQLRRGEKMALRGIDPLDAFAAAAAEFDAALEINALLEEARSLRGVAILNGERWKARFGKASGAVEAAAAGSPKDPAAWRLLATAELLRATLEEATGKDPRPACAAALEAIDRSLAIDPGHPESLSLSGRAFLQRAEYLSATLGDPAVQDLENAERRFKAAARAHPRLAGTHVGVARVQRARLRTCMAMGLPREHFPAAARAALQEALKIDPDDTEALMLKGELGELDALALLGEATPDRAVLTRIFDEALAAVGASRKIDPTDPRTGAVEGMILNRRFLWERREELLRGAIASFGRAVGPQGNPNDASTWTRLGMAHMDLPVPDRVKALECFDRARRINASDPAGLQSQGLAALQVALLEIAARRPPDQPLEEARAFFEKAVAINVHLADGWEGLGTVHLIRSRRATDPVPNLTQAVTFADQALKANATHVAARLLKGRALVQVAGIDDRYVQKALDLLAALSADHPGNVDAAVERAALLRSLGRHEEAVAGIEAMTRREDASADAWHALGMAYQEWGDALNKANEKTAAAKRHESSVRAFSKVLEAEKGEPGALAGRGSSRVALVFLALDRQDKNAAEEALGPAIEDLEASIAADPLDPAVGRLAANAINWKGKLEVDRTGDPKAGRERFERALKLAEDALKLRPGEPDAELLFQMGRSLLSLSRRVEALEKFNGAIAADASYRPRVEGEFAPPR